MGSRETSSCGSGGREIIAPRGLVILWGDRCAFYFLGLFSSCLGNLPNYIIGLLLEGFFFLYIVLGFYEVYVFSRTHCFPFCKCLLIDSCS